MIASTLIIFTFISILAGQICKPAQNNVVTSVIANTVSSVQPLQAADVPGPLSWEPVLYQLITFLSKACTR